MPYHIEIISIGDDFDDEIQEAVQSLNGAQKEFRFALAPKRLRRSGVQFVKPEYHSHDIFRFLDDSRGHTRRERPYMIGVVNKMLSSNRLRNIFGDHKAEDGLAAITLFDHERFVQPTHLYLCYYFIRYSLSFVCPKLQNHEETRGCFFDRKMLKSDIRISLDSGTFCEPCRMQMWNHLNEETHPAIQRMISIMKALRADSKEELEAASLKDQIDLGIITVREDDEYESLLASFPYWRHVRGSGADYSYTRSKTNNGQELRIVLARTPAQGPGPAQAVATSLITDLNPPWLFLVGIAGGIPSPDYTLGDVLLSQRMHDFAVSAALEGGESEFQDMGGPMALDVEKLITSLRARKPMLGNWFSKESIGIAKPREDVPKTPAHSKFYGDSDWRKKTYRSLRSHFSKRKLVRDPIFRAAVILTSGTLVKDTRLARQWTKNARHASGVEMELGGVWLAARHVGDGKTRVLAIRGLSDIVGYKRSPIWTEFAAYSAAAFARALILSGIIRRRGQAN